ncbi:MAG: cob(I)yrinic acid a,c-diamide adenosyltransferase [Bacteroidales bacterium]|nr:cob(I)yrinic acid a,c-diamide adenosyltransferase [Bacteroidales bacterium]
MKIYTKGGDRGRTGLAGGVTVYKDHPRIELNGNIDELNSGIGYLRALLANDHPWQDGLQKIQSDLMTMMGHIAITPDSDRKPNVKLPEDGASFCEKWIDEMEASLKEPSKWFILPGGNQVSAWLHMVRTQARRAERRMITLHQLEPLPIYILEYVNRLSDLFFSMTRFEMENAGIEEEKFMPFVNKG